ncbi:MAG: protein phosphatase 2C domain-containing protein [Parcubacteria group bacterium]|nr:protein phosphatase 2C domain-containing protein [Parcubacteria group bacterium]
MENIVFLPDLAEFKDALYPKENGNLKNIFEIAGGSVQGRDHRVSNKNNQDAYDWFCDEKMLIAVVCDGCGSKKYSEVGAHSGSRVVINSLRRGPLLWGQTRNDIFGALYPIATKMSSEQDHPRLLYKDIKTIIADYFLFSIVGAFITPYGGATFSIGDGVVAMNDEKIILGPFPNNEPPYIVDGLISTNMTRDFKVNLIEPLENIQSILIATDGMTHFIDAENKRMPGKQELVGPLSQFWTEDKYFKNSDMARRKLAMTNYDYSAIDWEQQKVYCENGLLKDDTTLIVIRRKKG